VLIRAGLVQLGREELRERGVVEPVVLPGGEPRLERRGGLLAGVGEHVAGPQLPRDRLHDVGHRQRLVQQRRIISHRDPGRGPRSAGVLDSELQQPRRRQPQRQLAAQPPHPGPMRLGPRLQGGLGPGVRVRRDEHPDQQLVRSDGRVLAVLQQGDSRDRVGPEPGPHLALNGPLQALRLSLIHGRLPESPSSGR
jgi:hypothetical protein